MKKVAIVGLTIFLGACAYKSQPILNPSEPLPAAAQSLPLSRIETLITTALAIHDWKIQHMDTGHVVATHAQEKISATVDIYFDQKTFQIKYNASNGMLAKDDQIHSHYNVWVRNLEQDIRMELIAGAAKD